MSWRTCSHPGWRRHWIVDPRRKTAILLFLKNKKFAHTAYYDFIQNTLPQLLQDVPNQIRSTSFIYDGAPTHFNHIIQNALADIYHARWIAEKGQVPWSACFPGRQYFGCH